MKVVDFKTEEKIKLLQSVKRESVELLLRIVWLVVLIYSSASFLINHAPENTPRLMELIYIFAGLWFFGEDISVLVNKKRRALHDYVGGTVVVRLNSL